MSLMRKFGDTMGGDWASWMFAPILVPALPI